MLDVDFENLRFDGTVKIGLPSDADVVLNAVDLEIIRAADNQKLLLYEQSGEKNRAQEALRGIDAGLERLRTNEIFLSRIG